MRTEPEVRAEKRRPMSLAVRLEAETAGRAWSERTYTDNVNSRGARVLSVRPWELGKRVRLVAGHLGFRAGARVVYCQPLGVAGFAVGLEFSDCQGEWVVRAES